MTDFSQRWATAHRMLVVAVLGFASGLPLALAGQSMQAWLSGAGVQVATIGFLSLVGVPYTFKFLWAPLMDRFDLPWLGRRRGWLVLTQLGLALALYWMASVSPTESTRNFALLALLVAFISASQDIVVDAYRTDVLRASERGAGASLTVLGYRLALVLSGGVAFIWVDPVQGGAWTWPEVYRFMAGLMVAAAVFSALALPRLPAPAKMLSRAGQDLLGFGSVVLVVVLGFILTAGLGPSAVAWLREGWCQPLASCGILNPGSFVEQGLFSLASRALLEGLYGSLSALGLKWAELLALVMGLAVGLPMAVWAARAARFETLLGGLGAYFEQPGAKAFLGLIVLYKLGDAFAGSLMTPFLLQGVGFSVAEMGVANKIMGLWFTIAGAVVGGLLMIWLGLWRSLLLFGVLQMLSNLGFWWLAVQGQGLMGALTLPAFNWGFVKLAVATPVDGGLLTVIALENLSGGMGTAAFVALLMSLCQQRFTATQFALMSAFASIGRVWVGPLAGVLAASVGWPIFFVISTLAAVPALGMLWWLRATLQALDVSPKDTQVPET